jgi:hypothetical protein
VVCLSVSIKVQSPTLKFKVIAFYTGEHDPAHISFVREANRWFPNMGTEHGFAYEATTNWSRLDAGCLANHQVVLFLDSRPADPAPRRAFQQYMEHGGAWMGFHFAGFALNGSACPQYWNWYHDQLLGAGDYAGNTWRPTSAVLRGEDRNHPATRHLPETFKSAPNEWYRWSNDLRTNAEVRILVSIDVGSFPLGTGPKPNEIWHRGYYPGVWTNRKYKMLSVNMRHNGAWTMNINATTPAKRCHLPLARRFRID